VGTLIVIGLAAVVAYALACKVWPNTSCPACKGSGRSRSPSGKAWRGCRRCGGKGSRMRIGLRLFGTRRS
jgi:hypothetical protein